MNGLLSTTAVAEQLCLACGICCNGVLFRDVELQPGDDAQRLRALELALETRRARTRFPQPCRALGADCRCHIYPDRPARCRDFECAVFKAVQTGQLQPAAALRTIRTALQQAGRVKQLLRELGDEDESLALSLRFKRLRQRFDAGVSTDEAAETYSQLTLAVHDLNLLLRDAFYPGRTD